MVLFKELKDLQDDLSVQEKVDDTLEENKFDEIFKKAKEQKRFDQQKFLLLFSSWKKTRSPKLLQELLDITEPIWKKAIPVFGGDPNDPLHVSYAKSIVIDGLNKFDPEKAKISTFLWFKLNNLQRKVYKQQNVLKTPEKIIQLKNIMHLIEGELEAELGREPSAQEVADRMGINVALVNRLRSIKSPITASSLVLKGEEGEDKDLVGVIVPGEKDKRKNMALDLVYMESSPIQQALMELVFGMKGKKEVSVLEASKRLKIPYHKANAMYKELLNRVNEYMYEVEM